MKRFITMSLIGLGLVSCATEDPRSIEWFSQHETGREAVLTDCARNAIPDSIECLNAQKAEDSLALKRRGYVKPQPIDFAERE